MQDVPVLSRYLLRLALAGALVASLGLTACGRKGPLDPPPGASIENEPQANLPNLMSTSRPPAAANQATESPNGQPVAPKGPKKQIPLDVLLN